MFLLPREMIIFALLFASANAISAPVYSNSSSSTLSGTSSITSSASLASSTGCPLLGLGAVVGCDVALQQSVPEPYTRSCYEDDINGNYQNCNRSGIPKYLTTLPADPYYADPINTALSPSLASFCYTNFNNSMNDFFRTASITPLSVVPATTVAASEIPRMESWSTIVTTEIIITVSTTIKGVPTFTLSSELTTITETPPWTWSAFTQYAYAETFSYTASAPCCLNCTIYGM